MSSQEFKNWQISDKHDKNGHKEAENRPYEANFRPPTDNRAAIFLTGSCLRVIEHELELVDAQKCRYRTGDGERVANENKQRRMGESSMFSIYANDG